MATETANAALTYGTKGNILVPTTAAVLALDQARAATRLNEAMNPTVIPHANAANIDSADIVLTRDPAETLPNRTSD